MSLDNNAYIRLFNRWNNKPFIYNGNNCFIDANNGSLSPGHPNETINIPLLRYINDDIHDTFEGRVLVNGVWRSRYTQNVGECRFNGTEAWSPSHLPSFIHINIAGKALGLGNAICTHFPTMQSDISYVGQNVISTTSGNDAIKFFADSSIMSDADTWRAYLASEYAAGTPVIVWYELTTPIVTYGDPTPVNTYPYYTRLSTDCEVQPDVSAKCKIIGG